MVLFGRRIATEEVPEWHEYYINYGMLKRMITIAKGEGEEQLSQNISNFVNAISLALQTAEEHFAETFEQLYDRYEDIKRRHRGVRRDGHEPPMRRERTREQAGP